MTGATALADLQRSFLARMQGQANDGLGDGIAHGRMPVDVGLGIYAHAYQARLREALDHDHPALGGYLGDALWDTLCRGYIAAHPSRHRSLRNFGVDLPVYLAQAAAFRGHAEIAELALFERRLLDSFDAADDQRADWGQLLARPADAWPALRVRFHPSVRRHRAVYGSVGIWRAIKDGQAPANVHAISGTDWILWRDTDLVSRFRSLDAEEGAALDHCLDGGDFAALCERLLDWHRAAAVPAAALGWLRRWCEEGWVCHWD